MYNIRCLTYCQSPVCFKRSCDHHQGSFTRVLGIQNSTLW